MANLIFPPVGQALPHASPALTPEQTIAQGVGDFSNPAPPVSNAPFWNVANWGMNAVEPGLKQMGAGVSQLQQASDVEHTPEGEQKSLYGAVGGVQDLIGGGMGAAFAIPSKLISDFVPGGKQFNDALGGVMQGVAKAGADATWNKMGDLGLQADETQHGLIDRGWQNLTNLTAMEIGDKTRAELGRQSQFNDALESGDFAKADMLSAQRPSIIGNAGASIVQGIKGSLGVFFDKVSPWQPDTFDAAGNAIENPVTKTIQGIMDSQKPQVAPPMEITPSELDQNIEKTGTKLKRAGMGKTAEYLKNNPELVDYAKQYSKAALDKISDPADLDATGPRGVLADEVAQGLAKLDKIRQEAGATIGDIKAGNVIDPELAASPVDLTEIKTNLYQQLSQNRVGFNEDGTLNFDDSTFDSKAMQNQVTKLYNAANSENLGDLSVNAAKISNMANWDKAPSQLTPLEGLVRRTAGQLSDAIESSAPEELGPLNEVYSALKEMGVDTDKITKQTVNTASILKRAFGAGTETNQAWVQQLQDIGEQYDIPELKNLGQKAWLANAVDQMYELDAQTRPTSFSAKVGEGIDASKTAIKLARVGLNLGYGRGRGILRGINTLVNMASGGMDAQQAQTTFSSFIDYLGQRNSLMEDTLSAATESMDPVLANSLVNTDNFASAIDSVKVKMITTQKVAPSFGKIFDIQKQNFLDALGEKPTIADFNSATADFLKVNPGEAFIPNMSEIKQGIITNVSAYVEQQYPQLIDAYTAGANKVAAGMGVQIPGGQSDVMAGTKEELGANGEGPGAELKPGAQIPQESGFKKLLQPDFDNVPAKEFNGFQNPTGDPKYDRLNSPTFDPDMSQRNQMQAENDGTLTPPQTPGGPTGGLPAELQPYQDAVTKSPDYATFQKMLRAGTPQFDLENTGAAMNDMNATQKFDSLATSYGAPDSKAFYQYLKDGPMAANPTPGATFGASDGPGAELKPKTGQFGDELPPASSRGITAKGMTNEELKQSQIDNLPSNASPVQKNIFVKPESDSPAFDQTPKAFIVQYESPKSYFGVHADNPDMPITELPKNAWVEVPTPPQGSSGAPVSTPPLPKARPPRR